MTMKKAVPVIIIIVLFFASFLQLKAGSLIAKPVIIDKKGEPRITLKEVVVLESQANYKMNIYAVVNNIDILDGDREFKISSQVDLSKSLANWIEISRGVIQLLPGEEKSVDLEIKIGPKAEAGIYHAKISFFEGSTREEAEARKQGPSVLVNLEISDNSQEGARLKKFSAEHPIFFKMPVAFSFRLENEENKPLPLDGRVMIYNRRGEEVAVLPINKEGGVASWEGPEQKLLLANLGETGGGFGRYKAILRLSYGAKRTLIQDTVFFWVIPWPIAVVFILILTALIGSIVYAFYKLYNQRSYDQIE